MVLKRGENVGDRYVKSTTEEEVLQLMIAGTGETAVDADEAVRASAEASL
jgi:simple sugar transport system ATP-binding protein